METGLSAAVKDTVHVYSKASSLNLFGRQLKSRNGLIKSESQPENIGVIRPGKLPKVPLRHSSLQKVPSVLSLMVKAVD
jgi:hypothetical protein